MLPDVTYLDNGIETTADLTIVKNGDEVGVRVVNAVGDVLPEINRIKNLRKTDLSKRIEELGKDLDKGGIYLIEGKAGAEIEERYGYFKRFKDTTIWC